MSDERVYGEGANTAISAPSHAQLSDLVRKAQVRTLLERLEPQPLFAFLSVRKLATSPVLVAGGGSVCGETWRCTPASLFTFPAWSATPFIRLCFRATIDGAEPTSINRFKIFFDCGEGFLERDCRTFNIIGDRIDLDAMIFMSGAAMGFAISPIDRSATLRVTAFTLQSHTRLRARVEMLQRRVRLWRRLRSSRLAQQSALRRALRWHRSRLRAASVPSVTTGHGIGRWLHRARRYAAHIGGVFKSSGAGGVAATLMRRLRGSIFAPKAKAGYVGAPTFRKQLVPIRSVSEARGVGPFVSILMPVYNTPPDILDAAIQSVLAQSWPNWELCICDDASTLAETRAVLESYRGSDWRIKIRRSETNLHIAGATNAAAELATGEFIAFLDHDDLLAPKALEEIIARVQGDPTIDLIYTDEDKLEPDGSLSEPYLKPDWSPEHLLSVMYVLHFLVVRKSLFLALGGLREAYSGAQDYDLALRASSRARKIVHISQVLYHWRKIPGSAAAVVDAKPEALRNARRAVEDHVKAIDADATVESGLLPGTHRVRWPIKSSEPVTLLILTAPGRRDVLGRGRILLVENFIDSILAKSTYRNFEIVVVASSPLPESAKRKIASANGRIVDYRYDGPFNFSAKMNFALEQVRTEDVILLNDDLEVISSDWIEALLEQSQRDEIGAVGARLLFADGRLQHAGILLGVNGSASHAFYGLARREVGCHGMTHIIRNYSAVTGAVLATRMSVLRRVGLLDTGMRIDFNDIDLCLKIRSAGYRIVYTPFAELYHFEGQSLARTVQDKRDTAAFLERWKDEIESDPYYNPRLPRDRTDMQVQRWLEEESIPTVDGALLSASLAHQRREAIARNAASIGSHIPQLPESRTFELQKAETAASGLFDSSFYLEQYADVAQSGMDPLDHFILYGAAENRRPCADFDTLFYRDQSAAGSLGEDNPLLHYIRIGECLGRAPSPNFDPLSYGAQHPDVIASGVSPLWHYRMARRHANPERRELSAAISNAPRIEVPAQPQRQWRRPSEQQLGVNFIGPLEIVSGLGVSARGYLSALRAAGIPTHVLPWRAGFEHQRKTNFDKPGKFAVEQPQPINLIHLNADIMHFALPKLRELLTADRYNIGIWYWELASFRPDWMEWIGLLDEIWCSSEFAANAIAANSRNPVRIVRPVVATSSRSRAGAKRGRYELSSDAFVFYYNFDVGSNLQRKNPLALIEAFLQEFEPDEGVQLLLKMHYSRTDSAEAQRLIALAEASDNIVIIDKTLSDEELTSLWSLVDCYVSPHRSEGLGLTVIEAMQARKPVIGTPYGGVADFLSPETGFPLEYDLIEIPETIEPYPEGFIWADPRQRSLRLRLRQVFENRDQAQQLAAAGAERIRQLFSAEVAGRQMARELRRIWEKGGSEAKETDIEPDQQTDRCA